jgi:hypothetical protein
MCACCAVVGVQTKHSGLYIEISVLVLDYRWSALLLYSRVYLRFLDYFDMFIIFFSETTHHDHY